MKVSGFAFDKDLETEGRWVEEAEGLRLKIARLNNPRYKTFLRKNGDKITKSGGRVNYDATEEVVRKGFAKYILLDWENLQDDEGNDIPYSTSKALQFLKEYDEFYDMVLEHAQDAQAYKLVQMEEEAGN